MLVKEAIEMSDLLNENKIPFEIKLKWLSDFETKIYNEVYATHEDCPEEFTAPSDEEDELLIEAPYDEVYVNYLRLRIDEANNDSARVVNSRILYNNAYNEFSAYYNRKHMPLVRAYLKFY